MLSCGIGQFRWGGGVQIWAFASPACIPSLQWEMPNIIMSTMNLSVAWPAPNSWQNLSATSVRFLSQQHENANQFINFSHMTYTGCGDYTLFALHQKYIYKLNLTFPHGLPPWYCSMRGCWDTDNTWSPLCCWSLMLKEDSHGKPKWCSGYYIFVATNGRIGHMFDSMPV